MTEEKEVPENQLLNLKNQPQFNYPLVHYSNLPEYMTNFVMDVVGSACECHLRDNEKSARIIKESLDQKYGPPWHVVVGDAFGFEITHESQYIILLFFGGTTGICAWKCM